MEGRQRSPSYPSTPLGEAIEIARKLHQAERTNAVDREVAAKAMGYSGISGRSATVLSNLIQYGLISKAGKNEVRVTPRTVDILYPDTRQSFQASLIDAAQEPELFQRIRERFPDGIPSENAVEAFLIRNGFTHTAVPSATRAFRETFLYIENMIESESHPNEAPSVVESQPNQQVERHSQMTAAHLPPARMDKLPSQDRSPQPFGVQLKQDMLWLEGAIRTRAEAERVIRAINGLKEMLPDAEPEAIPLLAKPEAPDALN